MKRVWFSFASIYAAGIAVTGLIMAYLCLKAGSLEGMRWWFALVIEGGFLLSPVVFVLACVIAGLRSFGSKTPDEEFSIPQRSKQIFLILGILLFLVIPFFLFRDAMFRSAARRGSIGSARLWLVVGANINSREVEGNTALTWAIAYGQQDMVAFLLKRKITFDSNDVLSMVPRGHEDMADVLKGYGAKETGRRHGTDANGCKRSCEQHRYAPFDQL
jgi:hypothetical protein